MRLLRDLAPLFATQLALLMITLLLGPGNTADAGVQLTWTGFLLLGWLVAPLWAGFQPSALRRYLTAMISAVAIHSVLAATGSALGFTMDIYLVIWLLAILAAAVARASQLGRGSESRFRLPAVQSWLILTLAVFVVCVYRHPRSNDIYQFMLQQQDMLSKLSFDVSSIGMSAMEVDQPMPRWRAHYWHLLPCLIAYTSGIAVDQVLLRYATIPVAFSILCCLTEIIRSLAGKRLPHAYVLIAIFAPVLLFYRNFNAFNYAFRITNNFLLDKDCALFFLVPATLWLTKGWIEGKARYLVPLVALTPALLRFHPLTAVYLVLAAAPLAALLLTQQKQSFVPGGMRRRMISAGLGYIVLFVTVFALGDAQSNHEQIREIIAIDYQQSQQGRPLHYWVGFYNMVPDTNLPIDTTDWTSGRFHLKHNVITGCGLLVLLHVGLAGLIANLMIRGRRGFTLRVTAAGGVTALMLWSLWLVSPVFLTRYPHFAGGFERLHWFAYPLAILVVATAITAWTPKQFRIPLSIASLIFIAGSALLYRFHVPSPLMSVRGLNSLLDFESDANLIRRTDWKSISPARSLEDLHPEFLRENDRVLLLAPHSTEAYWMTRQGVFWPDPYVEAFAWFHRGDEFLVDRARFYNLQDRKPVEQLSEWIDRKGITLIVDDRAGADEFIEQLSQKNDLPMKKIEQGVWRIELKSQASNE